MKKMLSLGLCIALLCCLVPLAFQASAVSAANVPTGECLEIKIVASGTGGDIFYRLGDPNNQIYNSTGQFFTGQAGYRIVYDVWLTDAVAGVGGFMLGNQSGSYYAANFAPDLRQVAVGQWYTVDQPFVDSTNAGQAIEQVGPSFRATEAVNTTVYYRNIRIVDNAGNTVFTIYHSLQDRVTGQEWIMRCEGSAVSESNYMRCTFRKPVNMLPDSLQTFRFLTPIGTAIPLKAGSNTQGQLVATALSDDRLSLSCGSGKATGQEAITVRMDPANYTGMYAVNTPPDIRLLFTVAASDWTNAHADALYDTALCVTENGGFSDTSLGTMETRLNALKNIGAESIRIQGVGWPHFQVAPNRWTSAPSDGTPLQQIQKIEEAGLGVKLIAPTIMNPPNWFYAQHPDAQLMDQNGTKAINTVSYWFPDLEVYTGEAIDRTLAFMKEQGTLDAVDTLVVDLGPAGEPFYPPAWTQSGGSSTDSMWCYDVNAQADFRVKMQEKYGTIAAANAAWGKSYADFSALTVPHPGTVSGQMWEDVLTWYRDSKRLFIEKQIQNFKAAAERYAGGRIKLLLYATNDVTPAEYANAISTGGTTDSICIMKDGAFIARMAAKYDCWLQYTGVSDYQPAADLRQYLDNNGYGDIPIFGENVGDPISASNFLTNGAVTDNGYWGVDFTNSSYLFQTDGVTPTAVFSAFASYLQTLTTYASNKIAAMQPLPAPASGAPEGECLEMRIISSGNGGNIMYRLGDPNYYTFMTNGQYFTGQVGYRIVYDVWLSDSIAGVGGFTLGNQSSAYAAANAAPDLRQVAVGQWYTVDQPFVDSTNAGQVIEQVGPSFRSSETFVTTVYYRNIRIVDQAGSTVFTIYSSYEDRIDGQNWIMRSEGAADTQNYMQCFFRKNAQVDAGSSGSFASPLNTAIPGFRPGTVQRGSNLLLSFSAAFDSWRYDAGCVSGLGEASVQLQPANYDGGPLMANYGVNTAPYMKYAVQVRSFYDTLSG